jgi:hypothetical protein
LSSFLILPYKLHVETYTGILFQEEILTEQTRSSTNQDAQPGFKQLIQKYKRSKENQGENMESFSSDYVVDTLSIGSRQRPELMEAQKYSFGTRVSVRHFFTATEDDDEDPQCDSHIVKEDLRQQFLSKKTMGLQKAANNATF